MNKKKILISVLVLMVLAALVYLQVRTWRRFDWHRFWAATQHTQKLYLLAGVGLVYFDYYLRALRWKIMLRPVCNTKASRLLRPTIIGFTGLALFGRPGEFIRPFLIARRENLTMASQVAVWIVERIFDMGAFALMSALNMLWNADTLRRLPGFARGGTRMIGKYQISAFGIFELSGVAVLFGVALLAGLAFAVRKNPAGAARVAQRIFGGISEKFGKAAAHRVHAFGEGLNTVQDLKSFAQLSFLSILIWWVIGIAYLMVTHAYRIHHRQPFTLSSVLLLTAASVLGGVVQLPLVGGGSQLATIGILHGVFDLPPELSISCGIMLWLVTFMSVTPTGLVLAQREHVSFMRLEKEAMQEEKKAEAAESSVELPQ